MVLHVTMHTVEAKVSIENNMNHLDELTLVVVELKINVKNVKYKILECERVFKIMLTRGRYIL